MSFNTSDELALENVGRDHLSEVADVNLTLEFQSDLAQTAEPKIEFRVEIERSGRLD